MVAKFVVMFVFVAAASCGAPEKISSFSYGVADPFTGDFKNQEESRIGNDVLGQYSLLESDGTRRTVDYAAGSDGFKAIVRKDPAAFAAYAASYAAPYAAPYAASYAAPYASYATPYAGSYFPITYANPALEYNKLGALYSTPYTYARYF